MLTGKIKFILISALLFSQCQSTEPINAGAKINGVNFVAPVKATTNAWAVQMEEHNIGWLAVIPYAFSRQGEPQVRFNNNKQWWGESTEGVKATIEQAKSRNLKVMVKPQVWMRDNWIGDFDLQTEADWKIWETDYRNYILKFAHLADSAGAEAFCIGTEYRNAVESRPQFWKSLITEIRTFYPGKLTYCANWDDYQTVPFWADLDYIGLSGYFPLSKNATPTVAQLDKAWKPVKAALKSYSAKYSKPILFVEIGYQNVDAAAWNSWEPVNRSAKSNEQAQANAYESFFRTFWHEPWVAGAFFWKWYDYHDAIKPGENIDWTPQNKQAQAVMAKYFSAGPGFLPSDDSAKSENAPHK